MYHVIDSCSLSKVHYIESNERVSVSLTLVLSEYTTAFKPLHSALKPNCAEWSIPCFMVPFQVHKLLVVCGRLDPSVSRVLWEFTPPMNWTENSSKDRNVVWDTVRFKSVSISIHWCRDLATKKTRVNQSKTSCTRLWQKISLRISENFTTGIEALSSKLLAALQNYFMERIPLM